MNIMAITETFLKRVDETIDDFLKPIFECFPLWLNPDRITLSRIAFAFMVAFFVLNKRLDIAFWFFIIGASSDFFDGRLARFLKKETVVGKTIDPIADKILILFTLLVIRIIKGHSFLPFYLFWSIIVFDTILFFLGGKAIASRTGLKERLGSNRWGKCKFFFQAIGISLFLREQLLWAHLFLWPSVVLAIASIIGHLAFKTDSA